MLEDLMFGSSKKGLWMLNLFEKPILEAARIGKQPAGTPNIQGTDRPRSNSCRCTPLAY